jgi:outer membrane protein W
MRVRLNALLLCLLAFPLSARAEEPSVPNSSWFGGLGGSFHIANFDQDMFASGVGNVYQGGTLVAVGGAGGPAHPRLNAQLALAAEAQLGYFTHFAASNWLWGAKLLYQYPATTASTRDIDPQVGALTTVSGPDSFTGNVVIGRYRTRLDHEIAFMPFIGHAFARSYVYLGAGPALFATQTNVDNAIGFADVNGVHHDVTGTPVSFASSQWVWGGAAQIGVAYSLDHGWFLDFNYTYARTGEFTSNFSAPFSSFSGGYQTIGTLFISPTQRITDQSFSISINKGF